MRAEIKRTNAGNLLLTVQAESEVEGISLERWVEENDGAPIRGLLIIATTEPQA
jgi:hypothetical protein